jgi:hypothetical protein
MAIARAIAKNFFMFYLLFALFVFAVATGIANHLLKKMGISFFNVL